MDENTNLRDLSKEIAALQNFEKQNLVQNCTTLRAKHQVLKNPSFTIHRELAHAESFYTDSFLWSFKRSIDNQMFLNSPSKLVHYLYCIYYGSNPEILQLF